MGSNRLDYETPAPRLRIVEWHAGHARLLALCLLAGCAIVAAIRMLVDG